MSSDLMFACLRSAEETAVATMWQSAENNLHAILHTCLPDDPQTRQSTIASIREDLDRSIQRILHGYMRTHQNAAFLRCPVSLQARDVTIAGEITSSIQRAFHALRGPIIDTMARSIIRGIITELSRERINVRRLWRVVESHTMDFSTLCRVDSPPSLTESRYNDIVNQAFPFPTASLLTERVREMLLDRVRELMPDPPLIHPALRCLGGDDPHNVPPNNLHPVETAFITSTLSPHILDPMASIVISYLSTDLRSIASSLRRLIIVMARLTENACAPSNTPERARLLAQRTLAISHLASAILESRKSRRAWENVPFDSIVLRGHYHRFRIDQATGEETIRLLDQRLQNPIDQTTSTTSTTTSATATLPSASSSAAASTSVIPVIQAPTAAFQPVVPSFARYAPQTRSTTSSTSTTPASAAILFPQPPRSFLGMTRQQVFDLGASIYHLLSSRIARITGKTLT